MKRVRLLLVTAVLIAVLAGCVYIVPSVKGSSLPENSASVPQLTTNVTESPLSLPSGLPSSSTPLPTATATPAQTPIGMSDKPVNEAKMYSSYANMVSFDPARGWADFDYFDMLRGNDAVQWLVDHEGYTLSDAQAEVADFADSEFIMKNTSSQLRTIDLRYIPLKLMYHPDGTMVADANPIDSDIGDVEALYSLNPNLLLHSFFFYITVESDGNVVSVEQVYWP